MINTKTLDYSCYKLEKYEKKIIVVVTIVMGYNVYTSLNKEVKLSDLALANVEALVTTVSQVVELRCHVTPMLICQ